ncbi:type II toxin-antitoxin system VapB family antitoxin [uncultured Cardiobacterium sp.]|uniref:antitoxin n=1 Tax=uncultured Cardiobacterium sp. TaxID=417619 RepID=UPI00262E6197|nr:type II toxin-antitoxin system VapB family antitoxin [uncultured Cardiobacterium sp.]
MLTKVFQSGNSQAVRIPLDYRFNTDTVEIFRADNGDIILRPARLSGEAFLDLFSGFDDDFIAALADRDDEPPPERDSL